MIGRGFDFGDRFEILATNFTNAHELKVKLMVSLGLKGSVSFHK